MARRYYTRKGKGPSQRSRASHGSRVSKKSNGTHVPDVIPGKCCDATMHGLYNWYKEMFEKLGWMVLAQSRGMTDKIQTYLNSLQRLHMALEQKITKIHDADKKEDLTIMLKNVEELLSHSQKDFKM